MRERASVLSVNPPFRRRDTLIGSSGLGPPRAAYLAAARRYVNEP